jgi:hypothetical protein
MLQPGVPHEVVIGAFWQAPAPLHRPVLPQGALADGAHCPVGAASPAAMFVQVPALPVTLQDWQVPQAADAQQTPSTQVRPLWQSAVALQVCPWWFRPQMFALQWFPLEQSASLLQAVLQPVPLQAYVPQGVVVAALQAPAPSQVRALVWVDTLAQLGAMQTVPAA